MIGMVEAHAGEGEEGEIPNSKSQIPNKLQTSNSNEVRCEW